MNDYGYPHPGDVTPEVQRLLEADAAMDAERAAEKAGLFTVPYVVGGLYRNKTDGREGILVESVFRADPALIDIHTGVSLMSLVPKFYLHLHLSDSYEHLPGARLVVQEAGHPLPQEGNGPNG